MSKNFKFILGALGALLLLYAIWYFRTIVGYVAIATVISFIGEPVVRFIRRIKIKGHSAPLWAAALLTLGLFMVIVVAIFMMFAPLIASQAQALSKIDYGLIGEVINEEFAGFLDLISAYSLSGDHRSNEEYIINHLQKLVSVGDLGTILDNFLGFISSLLAGVFSVLFIAFFFLRDAHLVGKIVLSATPDRHVERMEKIMVSTRQLLTRYFTGLVIQITIVTVLITLGLSIVGVENAFFIGFLAGLLNLIPYIGPIFGAGIGLFIALSTSSELLLGKDLVPLAFQTVIVFLTVQLLDNIILQPLIFSNSVSAHPLELFIVISLAGSLAGISGMILAIPFYTLFRIVAKEFLSGFKVIQSLTKSLDERHT